VFINFFVFLEDGAEAAAATAAGVTAGIAEELLRGVAWPEAVGVASMSLP